MRHLALLLLAAVATSIAGPAKAEDSTGTAGPTDGSERASFQLRRSTTSEQRSQLDPETGAAVLISTPLRTLLGQAWVVHPRDVRAEGGIDLDERFDVLLRAGRAADTTTMQALLAKGLVRALRLQVAREPQRVPINRLRRRDGEPALVPSTAAARRLHVAAGRVEAEAVSMRDLVMFLRWRTPRPILDETGLAAKYDFVLEWDPAGGVRAMVLALHDLGLELVRDRGEFPLLVVRPAAQ